MSNLVKPGVTIKGTKDGLLFLLDETRPFPALLSEIRQKLGHVSSQIWDGPDTPVLIKLGRRQITREEERELREVFSIRKNLIVRSIESEGMPYLADSTSGIKLLCGTVRSGQVLDHRGDLLFLGDVNPGGCIRSTGSLYVLGALRGLAHAGSEGDESAVIVASVFRPTQLRIADVISRPPDEWDESETSMRFAYLADSQIIVDSIHDLGQIRPELEWRDKRFKSL